jgi:hypothetical protein
MDESKKDESNMEQNSANKIKKFNNFRAEGIRLRNDILTLRYMEGRPLFKSIGKAVN